MLALIAGRGALPAAVAAAQADAPLVCGLVPFLPDAVQADVTFRLETLGSLLADLKARGVTRLCLCGSIGRPPVDPAAIDAATLPLVPRIQAALGQGDDGALRAVMAIIEEAGFAILAAHEAAPELVMDEGVPVGSIPPSAGADAAAGDAALAEMGAADLGQACVARDGAVIAREDEAGTDALLARAGLAAGLLFKAPKPGQDRRADLPTIGPATAEAARDAGLRGIVIEAGGVIVLDQPRVLALLGEAGMFLWVRKRPG